VSKFRAFRYVLGFALLFAMLGSLVGGQVLASQESGNDFSVLPPGQEEPPAKEVLELKCDYPVICGEIGESLEFEVEIIWRGEERRRFDLTMTVPPGLRAATFTQYGGYPEKPIAALELEPIQLTGNGVKIIVDSVPGKLPDPGDYAITFEVSSEEVNETIELTAKVSPHYDFAMVTQTLQLTTEVTAGEDNHLAVLLLNYGSSAIEDITLTSTEPEGWTITYHPEKIDSLASGMTQEVDVVITPPEKTVAGDWPVTLQAKSEQVFDELELRVTVLTSDIWGWVVILIIVVVIAGAGVVFWRLGRR